MKASEQYFPGCLATDIKWLESGWDSNVCSFKWKLLSSISLSLYMFTSLWKLFLTCVCGWYPGDKLEPRAAFCRVHAFVHTCLDYFLSFALINTPQACILLNTRIPRWIRGILFWTFWNLAKRYWNRNIFHTVLIKRAAISRDPGPSVTGTPDSL